MTIHTYIHSTPSVVNLASSPAYFRPPSILRESAKDLVLLHHDVHQAPTRLTCIKKSPKIGLDGWKMSYIRLMVAKVHAMISTAGYHKSRCMNLAMRACCSAEGPTDAPLAPTPSMPAENLYGFVQSGGVGGQLNYWKLGYCSFFVFVFFSRSACWLPTRESTTSL